MEPAAEEWICAHVDPVGPIVMAHDRPWARVMRVRTAAGVVWFKACSPVQPFEPGLSARLLADAGQPIGAVGNPPESWLVALPLYAELQRGEAVYVEEHLRHGVPDLRLKTLPRRNHELVRNRLPVDAAELGLLATPGSVGCETPTSSLGVRTCAAPSP